MITKDTILRGLKNSVHVIIELGKVLVPVTIIVTYLEQCGWLAGMAAYFTPFMGLFGLPGETALALVLGNLSTMYAGIGVLAALDLTVKQITIVSAMLLVCHSLLTETAIVVKAGGRPVPIVVSRVASGMAVGLFLNIFL